MGEMRKKMGKMGEKTGKMGENTGEMGEKMGAKIGKWEKKWGRKQVRMCKWCEKKDDNSGKRLPAGNLRAAS